MARGTLRRTLKIALVVGTLLSLINQGDVILAGSVDALTWLRVVANYVIPWAVSTLGFLSATGRKPGTPSGGNSPKRGQTGPASQPQGAQATAGIGGP